MKNNKNYLSLVTLVGLLFVTNCTKKTDTPTPAPSLTVICYPSSAIKNGIKIRDISYDANNRLGKHIDYDSTAQFVIDSFIPQYDGNNRVSKIEVYQISPLSRSLYLSFTYNNSGLIISDSVFVKYGSSYLPDSVNTYTYNGSNQIIKTTFTGLLSGNTGYINYTYDANSNVSQKSIYYGTTLSETVTYTYDTKNTFPFLERLNSFRDYAVAFSAKGNIISETHKDASGTIINATSYTTTYTYNSNNYPNTVYASFLDGTNANLNITYNCK